MPEIIGRKVGMTQLFSDSGALVSATAIEVEPNLVVDVKTMDRNGYEATVVGYGPCREKALSRPVLGQFRRNKLSPMSRLMEIQYISQFKVGDFIKIGDVFRGGDLVDIQGITRGHGYTGSIKLWNFSCGPRSHGAGYPHRFQGSLETGRGGMSPQKVWKGKRMAGRYGTEKVTMVNLEILHINGERNLVFVRGSVPGRARSLVRIRTTTRHRKAVETPFQVLGNEAN